MPLTAPLSIDQLREIQSRHLDAEDVRTLLWEIKRLQDQAVQIYNDLGVRSEFDALTARDMARMVRSRVGGEPAVVADASQRNQAKRQEIVRSISMPIGWAELYGVHSFHGPPLPQSDGR